jgi:hypothetical protein
MRPEVFCYRMGNPPVGKSARQLRDLCIFSRSLACFVLDMSCGRSIQCRRQSALPLLEAFDGVLSDVISNQHFHPRGCVSTPEMWVALSLNHVHLQPRQKNINGTNHTMTFYCAHRRTRSCLFN